MMYDDYPPDDLHMTVDRAIGELLPHAGEFDSIAVRGVSGLIVGAPVSLALNKPLVVARKPSEVRHAFRNVANATYTGQRYIILDDFVNMGDTVNEITEVMEDNTGARRVGLYLYLPGEYIPEPEIRQRFRKIK